MKPTRVTGRRLGEKPNSVTNNDEPRNRNRIEALLDSFQTYKNAQARPSSSTNQRGTYARPTQPIHDPAVDQAAWEISQVIRKEPGQDPALFHQRYAIRAPSPPYPNGSWIWDVRRIINDRIWNWLEHESRNPAARNGKLGFGRMTLDLFYRCNKACHNDHVNLVGIETRSKTKYSLIACPESGMVHLCRSDSTTCHSFDTSKNSLLICLAAGHVCSDLGVAMTHDGVPFDFSRAKRGRGYNTGYTHLGPSNPENMRRAEAITRQYLDGQRCGQIVAWEPYEGVVSIDTTLPLDTIRMEGSPPPQQTIDLSFMWEDTKSPPPLPPPAPATTPTPTPTPTTTDITSDTTSEVERLAHNPNDVANANPMVLEYRAYKANRRTNRKHKAVDRKMVAQAVALGVDLAQARPFSALNVDDGVEPEPDDLNVKTTPGFQRMFLRERVVVERVLHDILWDAEARRYNNRMCFRSARKTAYRAVSEALHPSTSLTQHLRPKPKPKSTSTTTKTSSDLVSNLLRKLITNTAPRPDTKQQAGTDTASGSVDEKPFFLLPAPRVQQIALNAMWEWLVPVTPFDAHRHNQLVRTILYLWRFVMHSPLKVSSRSSASNETTKGTRRFHKKAGNYNICDHQRRRREDSAGPASLAQFTLGFLYVAAESGIDIGQKLAWPKDWWLQEQLPSIKTLQYYGSQAETGTRILKVGNSAVGRTEMALLHPAATLGPGNHGSSSSSTTTSRSSKALRFSQPTAYQMKDVTAGKRAISVAVRGYRGQVPTSQEAAAAVHDMYTCCYDHHHHQKEKQDPPDSSSSSKPEADSKTSQMFGSNVQSLKNHKALWFSCFFVSSKNKSHVHICPMDNPASTLRHETTNVVPNQPAPPGLSWSVITRGGWYLDTAIGPFLNRAVARKFCAEWAKAQGSDKPSKQGRRQPLTANQHRQFGIRMATVLRPPAQVWNRYLSLDASDHQDLMQARNQTYLRQRSKKRQRRKSQELLLLEAAATAATTTPVIVDHGADTELRAVPGRHSGFGTFSTPTTTTTKTGATANRPVSSFLSARPFPSSSPKRARYSFFHGSDPFLFEKWIPKESTSATVN